MVSIWYLCIYIYIYIHIYIYILNIYIYTYACIYIYLQIYIYICVCVNMDVSGWWSSVLFWSSWASVSFLCQRYVRLFWSSLRYFWKQLIGETTEQGWKIFCNQILGRDRKRTMISCCNTLEFCGKNWEKETKVVFQQRKNGRRKQHGGCLIQQKRWFKQGVDFKIEEKNICAKSQQSFGGESSVSGSYSPLRHEVKNATNLGPHIYSNIPHVNRVRGFCHLKRGPQQCHFDKEQWWWTMHTPNGIIHKENSDTCRMGPHT